MAEVVRKMSFQEMVEVRKEEMESILPGFYTVLTGPKGETAKIYSKSLSKPLGSAPQTTFKSGKKHNKK
jgi:hypothetical protein